MEALLVVAGIALGWLSCWLALRGRQAALAERAVQLERSLAERADIAETLRSASAEALQASTHTLLDLARSSFDERQAAGERTLQHERQLVEQMIGPIRDTLEKVDSHSRALEASRREAYGELREQLQSLTHTQRALETETGRLVQALRSPQVRGRWGEMQLRRVVEVAGMTEHCDFVEQGTVDGDDGALRPDLVVVLPGEKHVVVDAKTPLQAYLDALEADDEAGRRKCLRDHARHVRMHVKKLSGKGYAEQFSSSPEFVVLFLPGEMFFSAALQADPDLTEHSLEQGVLIATPTTLMALLQTIAQGWRHECMAENAESVSRLGRILHKRLRSFTEHMAKLGRNIDRAVETYNEAVGSLETRVLVTARHFAELGAVSDAELGRPDSVDKRARPLRESPTDTANDPEIIDLQVARRD